APLSCCLSRRLRLSRAARVHHSPDQDHARLRISSLGATITRLLPLRHRLLRRSNPVVPANLENPVSNCLFTPRPSPYLHARRSQILHPLPRSFPCPKNISPGPNRPHPSLALRLAALSLQRRRRGLFTPYQVARYHL